MFPLSVVDSSIPETTKTSHAEITLKSATLPRRKPAKMEIQVEIKPKVSVWKMGVWGWNDEFENLSFKKVELIKKLNWSKFKLIKISIWS